jgi:DNA-binding transcriptional MerR regulator
MTTQTSTSYPKKLFYRIQEVANIVGVEPYVLRYWETKFPTLSPEKDGNDQRRYRQKDIDLLLRIRELLHVEKYTIAGAVEKLKEEKGSRRRRTRKSEKEDGSDGKEPLGAAESADVDEEAAFEVDAEGLSDEQIEQIRQVRKDLGLLRRELENWRDELA